MSPCPVCEEPGVPLTARAARPFTGRLQCRVCQCRLRAKRGIGSEILGFLAWLVLGGGLLAAIVVQRSAVFLAAAAASFGLECWSGLELDDRDAPSVRRAERIRRQLERPSP